MSPQEKATVELSYKIKDDEITRQIAKRKLAEQTRNWVVIISVIANLLIWLL